MTENARAMALEYFDKDHNCAQAVIHSLLDEYNLDYHEAVASMAGMGGGVGLRGNVCGAVSGAVAALGYLNMKNYRDVEQHKQETYTSAMKFIYKFEKVYETVICDELTGVKMADQDARTAASDSGHFHKTCPKYVEEAVRIVIEMENKT